MDYLVTGTRAYGPVTAGSDLDIVVKAADVNDLKAFLEEHNIKTYQKETKIEYVHGCFYFDMGGIQINVVIVPNEAEFELWKRRTERMWGLKPIYDRQIRINAFITEEM